MTRACDVIERGPGERRGGKSRERSAGRERAGQESVRADRKHDRGPGGAGGWDLAVATVRSRVVRLPALTARARAERSRPGPSPRDDGLAASGGLRTFPLLDGARARTGGTAPNCRLRLPANLSAAGGAPPAIAGLARVRPGRRCPPPVRCLKPYSG